LRFAAGDMVAPDERAKAEANRPRFHRENGLHIPRMPGMTPGAYGIRHVFFTHCHVRSSVAVRGLHHLPSILRQAKHTLTLRHDHP
jgi:hypothetical protein